MMDLTNKRCLRIFCFASVLLLGAFARAPDGKEAEDAKKPSCEFKPGTDYMRGKKDCLRAEGCEWAPTANAGGGQCSDIVPYTDGGASVNIYGLVYSCAGFFLFFLLLIPIFLIRGERTGEHDTKKKKEKKTNADGMVKITDRHKELIIGAGGESIAPVPIEDNIKELCPGISNVVMIGDKRKFNVALITLKAGAEGEEPGIDDLSGAALQLYAEQTTNTISCAMADEKVIAAIQKAIDTTNIDATCCPNNASKIQKWTILPHEFSVNGSPPLQGTLKTKRDVAMSNFMGIIDVMYKVGEHDTKGKYVPFALSASAAASASMSASSATGGARVACQLIAELKQRHTSQ